MKIITTLEELKSIPWQSVFECAGEFRANNPNEDLYEYMKQTWGIDHGTQHIRIVDEQKYMMFLLRWS